MIKGLETFKDYMKGYKNNFIIIGGSACDMLFNNENMPFRATKDIDMIITNLNEKDNYDFRRQFYKFLEAGKYHTYVKDNEPYYYRFSDPQEEGFPYMLELFSRSNLDDEAITKEKFTYLDKDEKYHFSAIIMDDQLFEIMLNNIVILEDLPVISPTALILMKAYAWEDMKIRKSAGERIDSKDIKKHKNDIVRLHEILTVDDELYVSVEIREKLVKIVGDISKEVIKSTFKHIIGRNVPDKDIFFEEITSKFVIK